MSTLTHAVHPTARTHFVPVSQTPNALSALRFARQHDWGVNAYLTASGEIAGLTMDWSDGVKSWTENCDPWPATVAAMREFGAY